MERTAIYGTGAISAGLAVLLTGNSLPTLVVGRSQSSLERCRRTMEGHWEILIAQGLASEANRNAAMALLTLTDDPAQLAGQTFVFEAVAEDPAVKQEVYAKIERCAAADTLIASTTSSLDAEVLAGLLSRPERLLIAHPFQPAHMLPLFEVVRHSTTTQDAVDRTCRLLTFMGREVVCLNRSVPGFLVNRLAQALFRESIHLIESGVTTAEDIDKAVKYAVGMRYASIGLLEYFDDVGFALEKAIGDNVYPDLCSTTQTQKTVSDGLASGQTGRTAGQGLHDWRGRDLADYQFRKQAPFFSYVTRWHMPD